MPSWDTLATGASGNIELERAWLRTVEEMFGIFCSKQHDYGPTNMSVGGVPGVVVRIGDKTSRLWEITGINGERKQAAVEDETIKDTLLDLANYGIAGSMLLDGSWPRVSPREAWSVREV